ncbi:KaiC domain-containing protein [Halopenitus persicus]|uniref:KaiC domain-containing protein n=1 Tax=Halopenitus persicus TaxID=1048396 RepID=UPI000BBB3945|nr:KaiC domain-containing protein [Halopenitus persicus]
MTEDGGSGDGRDRSEDEDAEEDWFERARRELAESRSDATAGTTPAEQAEANRRNDDEANRRNDDEANRRNDDEAKPAADTDETTGRPPETDEPDAEGPLGAGGFEDGTRNDGDEGGPGDADDPFSGAGIGPARDAGGPSAGGPSAGGPGAGSPGAGDGPNGEFGFAEFGDVGAGEGSAVPPGETDFDDAELDSDIERMDLGIEGLDEMILGGVPRRSLITTIGAAGTGKTTFALQFLHEALTNGDRGVYITLEESREAILSTAEEKGYDFRGYESKGLLSVVAIDPIEMANSLASIGNELGRLIREFDAERLVLDSVSLLEMMYDHPAKRRSEIFDFTRSLKEAGVTTMLISEASESNPYASRHGIVEYLTDAVFILQYVRPSDFRETRLAIEIQKIRNANHSRETKPYEITSEGISVYQQANIF